MKNCIGCGKEFDAPRRECMSCRTKKWRTRAKLRLVEHKGGKCQKCGYQRLADSLVFHHLNPEDKEFKISEYSKGFILLKEELKKCVLFCANCHGEVHAAEEQVDIRGDRKRLFELHERLNALSHRDVFAAAAFQFHPQRGYSPSWDTMSDSIVVYFFPEPNDSEKIKQANEILDEYTDLEFYYHRVIAR